MNTISYILISIVVGFSIGYLTNKLALYMLFHPKNRLLGLQGVIPKRKNLLAEKTSEQVHLIFPKEYKKVISIPIVGNIIDKKVKESISKTIKELPDDELEKMIKQIVKHELFYIEMLGGIVGGLIGLIQGLIFVLF